MQGCGEAGRAAAARSSPTPTFLCVGCVFPGWVRREGGAGSGGWAWQLVGRCVWQGCQVWVPGGGVDGEREGRAGGVASTTATEHKFA
ncbi:hypothetical protein E2C01_079869 [Portunus trituberculatus]|uniref:Uncharacterized protein n=1 Tax=Portunus trituberculatus TaxID=210409 RepID=A0A5B7IKN5_PORTR|nr:hypothetical protein [Portunus trituberculatus]